MPEIGGVVDAYVAGDAHGGGGVTLFETDLHCDLLSQLTPERGAAHALHGSIGCERGHVNGGSRLNGLNEEGCVADKELQRQAIRAASIEERAIVTAATIEEIYLPRAILESLSNSVVISDATTPGCPVIYVNPAFEKLTGYAAAEVCGQNCRFLHRGDDQQPGVLEIRASVRERREARVLLRNYRKDGTLFWNELHLSLIHDEAGRLTHFLGIQNDVTAQVEATLRSERESSRIGNEANLILRTVGDGIYGLDENGVTTFANPAAEAITGWTAEEMVGKPQHAMIHHSHADGTNYPREACHIYKALRDGQVHSSDSEVFWK